LKFFTFLDPICSGSTKKANKILNFRKACTENKTVAILLLLIFGIHVSWVLCLNTIKRKEQLPYNEHLKRLASFSLDRSLTRV